MPAGIIAWVRQQFFDNNGDPLSSGTLEFYESGTSTPLAVYSDAELSVSAGTTITLNSAGFPQVSGSEVALYLQPRAYRVVVKNSAGTTLRTIDGVYALQAASSVNLDISDAVAGEALSAGDAIYLSDGSGSLTAGRWYRADADNTYSSTTAGKAGFAMAAASGGATFTVRIGGVVTGLTGLVDGDLYYVSATAGALTATPPTNARLMGQAISSSTLVIIADSTVRLPDSDGTHHLVIKTTSNLTADRLLTLVPGDAARTVTINGDSVLPAVSLTAVRVYTSSDTWTKPATIHSVVVWVVGGGGGGGGTETTGGAGASSSAGGGGGGASMKRILAASLGATEAVTVGGGGSGGAAGLNAGSAGGTSSFGSHLSATGGAGGGQGASNAPPGMSTDPGAGGTGSTGDLNLAGGPGTPGISQATATHVIGGNGGNSIVGGGGRAVRSSTATAGGNYGGGGSGAANPANTNERAGGNGAGGVVIVYEFTQ